MDDLVSVVIVNWNGEPFLGKALDSVLRQDYRSIEIIAVDNASTDRSVDLVRERYPQVKLLLNGQNLGFAAGNNMGIRHARGRYIVLLNNDVTFPLDEIDNAIGFASWANARGMNAYAGMTLKRHDTPAKGRTKAEHAALATALAVDLIASFRLLAQVPRHRGARAHCSDRDDAAAARANVAADQANRKHGALE